MKYLITGIAASAMLLATGCSSKDESIQNIENTAQEKVEQDMQYIKPDLKNVYFYFDSTELDDKSVRTISENLYSLEFIKAGEVLLRGHTDEWGSDEYNYALGLKRAEAVKTELENKNTKLNISTISLGESEPTCTDKTVKCWSDNRRVEFK